MDLLKGLIFAYWALEEEARGGPGHIDKSYAEDSGAIVEPIEEIVDTYVSRYVMPNDPRGDALHLALASYHHCHFLLTWNCSHLANANKFEHIRHVNTILGLYVPIITTPVELLYWEDS